VKKKYLGGPVCAWVLRADRRWVGNGCGAFVGEHSCSYKKKILLKGEDEGQSMGKVGKGVNSKENNKKKGGKRPIPTETTQGLAPGKIEDILSFLKGSDEHP
jgi:hypothetical protein